MNRTKHNLKEHYDYRLTKAEAKKLREDFCKEFKVSDQTFYAILRGARKDLKAEQLRFFAKRMKCNMEELFNKPEKRYAVKRSEITEDWVL